MAALTSSNSFINSGGSNGIPNHQTGVLQKALELNLDNCSYGAIAEIGAGQEVARFFFRAGGAAGTVAKSMSAYDMKVSDSIYGEGTRYVSRDRLKKMLAHEYHLLVDRLAQHRPPNTQFFAFADTVAARSFKTRGECHGWMGCCLQLYPNAEPSSIIIHIRMLDESAEAQQDALGILGVNLIYGAYNHWKNPVQLLASLKDNLFDDRERINIDLVQMEGGCWDTVDPRILNMRLLELNMAHALMFNSKGETVLSSEALYKKSALVVRGHFRPATLLHVDMMAAGRKAFGEMCGDAPAEIVTVAEISTQPMMGYGKPRHNKGKTDCDGIDIHDFMGRVDTLGSLGCHVMVTNIGSFWKLRQYLNCWTKRDIGIVVSTRNVHDVFDESFYTSMEGGLFEVFGKLFTGSTRLFVYPSIPPNGEDEKQVETLDNLVLPDRQMHLLNHLKYNKFMVSLEGYQERDYCTVSMPPESILSQLEKGDGAWKDQLPDSIYDLIKSKRLFGYGTR